MRKQTVNNNPKFVLALQRAAQRFAEIKLDFEALRDATKGPVPNSANTLASLAAYNAGRTAQELLDLIENAQ